MPAKHYNEIRKLGELMKDVRICMLTTVDEDGALHSRPMAVQQVEFDGDLWFFTGKSSRKTSEVEREQRVNVSFSNPEKQHYVSVSGIAVCVDDQAKAKELWMEPYRTWFPKGLNDPDLTLMKVTVEKAEYWDSPNSAVTHLVGYLKAVTTGECPDPGEHEEVNLRG
jgi:general stress protein 26